MTTQGRQFRKPGQDLTRDDLTPGKNSELNEQISELPGPSSPAPKGAAVPNQRANSAINTAAVPLTGTGPGGAPARTGVVSNNERPVAPRKGFGAPNAEGTVRVPLSRSERLEQRRVAKRRKFVTGVTTTATSNQSVDVGGKSMEKIASEKAIADKVAKISSIAGQTSVPGGSGRQANARRSVYFGVKARDAAVETKTAGLNSKTRSDMMTAGREVNRSNTIEKLKNKQLTPLEAQNQIVRPSGNSLAAQGGKVIGQGSNAKRHEVISALRGGHITPSEAQEHIHGINEVKAEAEKKVPSLNYYLGENTAGEARENKGLADTKIAEIAHHTGHDISHVRGWLKSTGLNVHTVHKDLTSQIYDNKVTRKAYVPTGDVKTGFKEVKWHPKGFGITQMGRDADGANMGTRKFAVPSAPPANAIDHKTYTSMMIHDWKKGNRSVWKNPHDRPVVPATTVPGAAPAQQRLRSARTGRKRGISASTSNIVDQIMSGATSKFTPVEK